MEYYLSEAIVSVAIACFFPIEPKPFAVVAFTFICESFIFKILVSVFLFL